MFLLIFQLYIYKLIIFYFNYLDLIYYNKIILMGIGDWGLGIGFWVLGVIPNS